MKAGPLPRSCLLLPVEVRAAESNGILSSSACNWDVAVLIVGCGLAWITPSARFGCFSPKQ